jgi:mRNA interferase MazF
MPPTTTYRQGDIVLVSFPFTDLTSAKRRPALVISPDSLNQINEDLILVAITSQMTADEYALRLEESDFLQGKLPKPSMIKLTKIFTIHSTLAVKKLCRLKPEKVAEVLNRIHNFLS